MSSPRLARLAVAGLLVLLPGAGHAQVPLAGPPEGSSPATSRRLLRDINVMEKVIDQMLIDSRNLLVYSHENNARGLYLDEFGVLFSFQASLIDRETGQGLLELQKLDELKSLEALDFKIEEKDGHVIIIPKSKGKAKPAGNAPEPPDTPAPPGPPARAPTPGPVPKLPWHSDDPKEEARLYAAGKGEILDTLLDYGDTMNSLRDDQWLGIAAFLRNSDYFIDNRISRLLMKARMRDLRAYAAGRLTREQMAGRVVVEEY